MKRIILFVAMISLLVSCQTFEVIPQAALPGIWKLNGYASTNYKVEITNDGYLYWFNYNDNFNRVEEFEIEYNPNQNNLQLYRPNGNQMIHQFNIYRQGNGRLYFEMPINGYDANGQPITNIDTYYQM